MRKNWKKPNSKSRIENLVKNMKITQSIFGKEENDIDKFNELDLDERSIVFYSESSVILYPYVEEMIRELQKRDQKICYLTSSKDDPVFKNESKNIKVFYIGDSEIEKMKFWKANAFVRDGTRANAKCMVGLRIG